MHIIVRPNPSCNKYMPRPLWEWILLFWMRRPPMATVLSDDSVVCHPDNVPTVLAVLRSNGYTCEVHPPLRLV